MASKPRRPHSTGRLGQDEGAPRPQGQLTSISQCSLGVSIKTKFRKAFAGFKQTANGILASVGSFAGSAGTSSKCEKSETAKRRIVRKSPRMNVMPRFKRHDEKTVGTRTFGAFECVVCRKFFRQKEKLEKHFRIHRGDRPFRCNRCWKSTSWKAMIARSPISSYRSLSPTLMKPVKSPIAGAKCGRSRSLPPSPGPKSACCWAFGSRIPVRGGSMLPRRQAWGPGAGAARKAANRATPVKRPAAKERVPVSEDAATNTGLYNCYVCGKRFEMINQLNLHVLRDHGRPIECMICGKIIEECNFLDHLYKHPWDRLYRCDLCGTSWSLNAQLRPAPFSPPGRRSPRPVRPKRSSSSVKKSSQ